MIQTNDQRIGGLCSSSFFVFRILNYETNFRYKRKDFKGKTKDEKENKAESKLSLESQYPRGL